LLDVQFLRLNAHEFLLKTQHLRRNAQIYSIKALFQRSNAENVSFKTQHLRQNAKEFMFEQLRYLPSNIEHMITANEYEKSRTPTLQLQFNRRTSITGLQGRVIVPIITEAQCQGFILTYQRPRDHAIDFMSTAVCISYSAQDFMPKTCW